MQWCYVFVCSLQHHFMVLTPSLFSSIVIRFSFCTEAEDGHLRICFLSSRYLLIGFSFCSNFSLSSFLIRRTVCFFSRPYSECWYYYVQVVSCHHSSDLLNCRHSWSASLGSQTFPMVRTCWLDVGVPPFESFSRLKIGVVDLCYHELYLPYFFPFFCSASFILSAFP